jgi:glycosyltransferase involved in cell wall biosynthesis
LRQQALPREQWELIVVDNASRDPISGTYDLTWHPNGHHIFEGELGLAPARRRGIREATGALLVFVDDDNVLNPDYLSTAKKIALDWPQLGVWGSASIEPEFEQPPPAHMQRYLQYLALRNDKSPRWSSFFSIGESPPVGAGLCVRTEVVHAYLKLYEQPRGIRISGRKGNELGGAEDYEICLVACSLGLGIGQFPTLKLTHLIPKERVSDDYMTKVVEGSHSSISVLMYKWRGEVPASPYGPLNIIWFLRNMLNQRGFDRKMFLARWRGANRARRIIMTLEDDRAGKAAGEPAAPRNGEP